MSASRRAWGLPALLAGILVLELSWHAVTTPSLETLRHDAARGAADERRLALQRLACRPEEEAFVRAEALRVLEGSGSVDSALREAVFSTTLARLLPGARLERALERFEEPAERARCAFLLRYRPSNESDTSQSKWIDLDSFRRFWEGTYELEDAATGVVPPIDGAGEDAGSGRRGRRRP